MSGDFGKETYFPTEENPDPWPLHFEGARDYRNPHSVHRGYLRPAEKYGWYIYTHYRPREEFTSFIKIDGGTRYANLFWYGQRHGGVCLVFGPLPSHTRVFMWGCEHPKPRRENLGLCLNKYICEDCGASWEVDSSG